MANGLSPQLFEGENKRGAAAYQFGGERQDAPRMIERCFVLPQQLQYYRKPLKESEWVLQAVSSYLKGNLDLGQMCMAYHIFAKEWEARSLRTELIESFEQDNKDIDIARAAGLESPDVQETIGRYSP